MTLESICRGIEKRNEGVTRKEIDKAVAFYFIIVASVVFAMIGFVTSITENTLALILVGGLTLLLSLFILNYVSEEEGAFPTFNKVCKFWWLICILSVGIYFLALYIF